MKLLIRYFLISLFALFTFTGCETMDEIGDDTEDAAEEVGDEIEEATD